MASDYNASLIAELYSAQSVEDATHISDEMLVIKDPIFPRQIYEAYKKYSNTYSSHYFVSDLAQFKSDDADFFLKEIADTTNRDADLAMALNRLTEIEFFEATVVKKIKDLFVEEIKSGDIDEYEIEQYTLYLQKSGQDINELSVLLKEFFENEKRAVEARKRALQSLLRLKASETIQYYFDNYETIKGKKSEVAFVEEISTWKDGIVPKFHEKILNEGSNIAKEIIQRKIDKVKKEQQKKLETTQKEVKQTYETADVISEIASLRSGINKFAISDERFGSPLFAPSEEIYKQGIPAKSKAELTGYSMDLRSVFGAFDKSVMDFQITKEKAEAHIPGIANLKGGINLFHLLLLEKGIKVDEAIFGIRNVNRIVTKLAHPDELEGTEFLELINSEGIAEAYNSDNWSLLHREILGKYKESLKKLLGALMGVAT